MTIKPEIKEKLEQLQNTPYGQALLVYLEQYKEELNSINKIITFEELLGKQYALKLIDEMFKFMDNKRVEVKSKNQYI